VGGAARSRWRLVAGYFAVLLVVAFVGYTVSPNGRWFDTPVFWLLTNAAPTVNAKTAVRTITPPPS